jgi:hypothetical protein
VSATLELSLSDTSGKFFVTGEVGGGDATKLTELTEPMGMTRIKSGTVDGLRFNITGTNTQASGTVIILYKDLVVELLEVDKHKPGGVDRKDISSFMGNLMIKDNNPVPGHPVRTATVQHDRDMNRSFYNLVWKTLFDGINQTIGNKQKFKP